MEDLGIVIGVGGFLLLIFTFISNNYWEEARDFYFRAKDRSKSKKERLENADRYGEVHRIFRVLSGVMSICSVSVFIPVSMKIIQILPRLNVPEVISVILLGVSSLLLVVFLIRMACGRYFVEYLPPKDLKEEIENDCSEYEPKDANTQ